MHDAHRIVVLWYMLSEYVDISSANSHSPSIGFSDQKRLICPEDVEGASQDPDSPDSSALIALSMTCVFLFSGILFGWQPLLSVLESRGEYHELCPKGTPLDTPCAEQQTALNQMYTFGSTALSLVALPAGLFIDRYGPRISLAVSTISLALGLCLLGVSSSLHFPAFVPAYCLLAIGGIMTMFSSFRCAFLPGKAR